MTESLFIAKLSLQFLLLTAISSVVPIWLVAILGLFLFRQTYRKDFIEL